MTHGVGMDLIEIARIERALDRRPRLAERLFTPDELRYAESKGRPGRHLAARFAAKEAVIKALALDGGTRMREIEVVAGEPPVVRAHGAVREQLEARGVTISISLTHSREMAAAVAVADRPSAEDPAQG